MKHALIAGIVSMSLGAAVSSSAAPSVGTPPKVTPVSPSQIKVKVRPTLAVKSAAAVPGETRTLEATLMQGQTPVAGKPVAFRLEGKNGTSAPGGSIAAGSGVTNAQGVATTAFKVPELAQGAYRLVATFAGDDAMMGATDDGNFGVIKVITEFDMGDLIWGTYKNEPGPPMGSVMISLRRKSDSAVLSKRFWVTVNGQRWQVGGGSSSFVMLPLPSSATTWNVKVEFEGDDANQATAAQRTYKKPG